MLLLGCSNRGANLIFWQKIYQNNCILYHTKNNSHVSKIRNPNFVNRAPTLRKRCVTPWPHRQRPVFSSQVKSKHRVKEKSVNISVRRDECSCEEESRHRGVRQPRPTFGLLRPRGPLARALVTKYLILDSWVEDTCTPVLLSRLSELIGSLKFWHIWGVRRPTITLKKTFRNLSRLIIHSVIFIWYRFQFNCANQYVPFEPLQFRVEPNEIGVCRLLRNSRQCRLGGPVKVRWAQPGRYRGSRTPLDHQRGISDWELLGRTVFYTVCRVVSYLGWVDFDLDVPPSCPAAQPILPNSHLPKQSLAGMSKLKVNPTRVTNHHPHPVQMS